VLYLSKAGVAYNITINRVFYKYGNYEALSASRGDYLAIKYKSRLLGREERYAFFDLAVPSNDSRSTKEYYSFSGYSIQNGGGDESEIPWLFQATTLIQLNNDYLELLNVTNVLRGYIKRLSPEGQAAPDDILYTQKIQITANNIASARSAIIILKAVDLIELTAWQIALIVLGSIAVLVASIFAIRFGLRKYK
jgi:hypothetical protein